MKLQPVLILETTFKSNALLNANLNQFKLKNQGKFWAIFISICVFLQEVLTKKLQGVNETNKHWCTFNKINTTEFFLFTLFQQIE